MASICSGSLFKVSSSSCQLVRNIHLYAARCLDHKWRDERKLPTNPNSFGPLTNLPDYSFKDGRPVPYGVNQKKRIEDQRQKLLKIKHLVGEIDYAVIKHEQLKLAAENEKQHILSRKLKEKGSKLSTASKANQEEKMR